MNKNDNVLITIPVSHYCEKARWGLEWVGIPYRESQHLQGFNYLQTIPRAKSRTVPVLITKAEILTESRDILTWCDSHAPANRRIYPDDHNLKNRIREFEDYLDLELGVAGRLWMYTYMLSQPLLILKISMKHQVPKIQLLLLPLFYPWIKWRIKKILGYEVDSREKCVRRIDQVFDHVGEKLKRGEKNLLGISLPALISPLLH